MTLRRRRPESRPFRCGLHRPPYAHDHVRHQLRGGRAHWLSDQGFPVEHVRIVGTGLRYVEQVSGRLTTGRAALTGIGQGGVLGLFWGLLFSLFFTTDTGSFFGVLTFSLVVGIVFGGLVGAVSHLMTDDRRDFDSVAETRADRYEVHVEEGFAGEAERLLPAMPSH
jgi:hypothetical protein